jgi:hypothetical protein
LLIGLIVFQAILSYQARRLDNHTPSFLDFQPTKQTSGWTSLFPAGQPNTHSPTLPTSWMSSRPTICEEEGSILFTVVYKGRMGGFILENWLYQGKN